MGKGLKFNHNNTMLVQCNVMHSFFITLKSSLKYSCTYFPSRIHHPHLEVAVDMQVEQLVLNSLQFTSGSLVTCNPHYELERIFFLFSKEKRNDLWIDNGCDSFLEYLKFQQASNLYTYSLYLHLIPCSQL